MPRSLSVGLLDAGSITITGVAPANYASYIDSDDGSLLLLDGNVVIIIQVLCSESSSS